MKSLYILSALILVMPFISFPVKATEDFIIMGTIFNDDATVASYASINLADVNTDETMVAEADVNGNYSFHLDELAYGWAYEDEIKIIATSHDGLWTGYYLTTYLYPDCGNLILGLDPFLPPQHSANEEPRRVCDMNEYKRDSSRNKWDWHGYQDNTTYTIGGNPLKVILQATGYAHDFGDDIPVFQPPRSIHVMVTFTFVVGQIGNPPDTYKQKIGVDDYNLSRNETYHWDPYWEIELPVLWNEVNLTIQCGIKIDWTDWNYSYHPGTWNYEDREYIKFKW